MIGKF